MNDDDFGNLKSTLDKDQFQRIIFVFSSCSRTPSRPDKLELRMNCEKHEEELHHMGTDHCAGSPCQHGTCENINGGYFCNCDSGWEGRTCGDDFNECIHFGSSEWFHIFLVWVGFEPRIWLIFVKSIKALSKWWNLCK